jgi:glycosyltransferase involved in cell wall biosynthesis
MNRIAMLIPTLDQIGGAERQVLLLAKELSQRGWQITVIALSGNGEVVAQELEEAGVSFLSLRMRKAWVDPRGWLLYFAWAARNRPEVLHSHLPHATFFARCSRFLLPARVLIDTIHTSSTGGAVRKLGYRLSHWLSTHVTCVSESVAAAVTNSKLAPRENLSILPNGIFVPNFTQSRNHRAGQSGSFRWIAVGRLAPVKDYPTLLRAFAVLPGQPTLEILGSGPEEQNLRRLASELKIQPRVHFAGFQSEVNAFLANAHAFVLSSLWEGLPISVLEAAAARLPVVATDARGVRETVQSGKTGFIVPVGDILALTHAMARVMSMSPGQRQALGDRGRTLVESRYSLSTVIVRWEDLYSSLLLAHPRPSRRG